MAKLTEEQKQAIDNYGNEIRTLKDHITAIRTKPGMYIGHTGYKGFLNMMREIFQNSIDQILSPKSPANWFSFYYNENTLEVRVEDNGMSLPYDDIARIFTKAHTSKNFEKELYDYSSGTHGEGGKAVNALSLVYRIEAYHYDGTAVMMEFEQGYPKTKAPVKIPNKEKKQGLVTYFIPDQEIMGENCRLDWKTVYHLIKRIMSLTPIGSRCDFTAISHKGKEFNETIINKDGIITDLIMKVSNPINKPIIFGADDGTRKVDIAFCYEAPSETGESDKESITSFANFCPTLGGTHVDSSMDAICRWFVSYMNNIYLANQKAKDKMKIVSADIKSGLNIFISAAHLYPVLVGQSKELLSNEDMIPFCKDVVNKGLDDWSKSNPQDLAKLCKYFKDMAEIRLKQEGAKAKIATKYSVNPITKYPRKYKKPINKTGIELIIVEGDSALGKAETDRDPYIQGKNIAPYYSNIVCVNF